MSTKAATRKELELALKRITHKRTKNIAPERKLSVAAVAKEAGVSSALIFNSHKDFAEHIRQLTNRPDSLDRRDEKLTKANSQIMQLQERIDLLESDLKKIAIQNLMLSEENKRLKQKQSKAV
jgi:TolA-binding protein